jgi:GDP-L-fucose synthase
MPSSPLSGRRVVVTGGSGFLGRVVVRKLAERGAVVVAPRSRDHDLRDPAATESLFAAEQPELVVHLAARVGGIGFNQVAPAQLYLDNLLMGTYVLEAARRHGVERTVCIGTVCSYPKFTPVPFTESRLWDGYPEETNAPYGIAKKALLVHAQVNRAQYGQRSGFLIPTNLYGPGDKFHPSVSHGRASREYLYVDDAAEGIALATEALDDPEPVNLGTDTEITIRETVERIAGLVGFEGELVWDPTKPDGQPRRRVDAKRAEHVLGWRPQMDFDEGLRRTIDWYLANRAEAERDPG